MMKRSLLLSLFLWICSPISKIINRINWRFGRPYRCHANEVDLVKESLQSGVVILTHRKYEFTTLFIPGYWTHSALVVSPGLIVEATGKGVRMNTPESFFSTVDDFIVLKPRFCCQDVMKKAAAYASTLIGFPFSFDFRNSGEMFYCSGLICRVYTQTMGEEERQPNIPYLFKNFLEGNIIKPEDFYLHREAWQIVDRFA